MFGHLKAEDFTNLLEGAALDRNSQAHLKSCPRCAETLKSAEEIRRQLVEAHMTAEETIPEPDWSEFRSDVRNALLSRSVTRENARSRWLGWIGWRPALAFGLSLFVMIGAAFVVWNGPDTPGPSTVAGGDPPLTEIEAIEAATAMSSLDVFDEVVRLDQSEAESLLLLLERMEQEGAIEQ